MAIVASDIEEIRRRMAQIRRDLHEDVQGVVSSAEAAADWRRYLKAYPWATVGAAFVVGYLIVPRRHRQPIGRTVEVPVEAPSTVAKKERRAGLVGALFGMVTPVLTRAVQTYAAQYLEGWIAQQAMAGHMGPLGPQPSPGEPGMPGRPGPAGR